MLFVLSAIAENGGRVTAIIAALVLAATLIPYRASKKTASH
jgi:hypothetical protein